MAEAISKPATRIARAALLAAMMMNSAAFAAGPRQFDRVFSTYFGGSGSENSIRGVCADKQGNIIVVGGTSSADFPTTKDAFCRNYNAGKKATSTGAHGPMDAFVAKFDPSGHLLWSTYLGGPNYDRAYAVQTDPQDNIYVAGRAGEGFPVTQGAFQTDFVDTHQNPKSLGAYGKQNGFVAKLTPPGKLLWASYVGSGQLCRDIAVDDQGDVYVPSGWNGSGQAPPAEWFANGFQKAPRGKDNPAGGSAYVCVLKIKGDGSRVLWGTWLNGSEINNIEAMLRVDADRNVYYGGFTASRDMPLSANGRKHAGGNHNLYLAKLSPDGSNLLYGTYLGGSGNEGLDTHSLAVDGQGNAYFDAFSTSTDCPVTPGAFQPKYSGRQDLVIFKVGPHGDLLACTYLGASAGPEGLSADEAGNVYLTGTTHSPHFPAAGIPYQAAYGSTSGHHEGSAFLAVMSPDLRTLLYSTYIGGQCAITGQNAWGGIHDSCLAPDGSVIVAGNWFSDLWPTTADAYQPTFKKGRSNGVLARFKTVYR